MSSIDKKYKLTGNGPWIREIDPLDVNIPNIRVTSVMPEDLWEQFLSTIEAQGIINPVKCIYDGEKLILVDGLHRLEGAIKAGIKSIPAIIQKADIKTAMYQNLASGKLQGRGKATDMIKVIKYLVEEEKEPIEEIATKTGYKLKYIEDLLAIANAHPDILLALDEEKISLGAAKEIARIPDTDAQLKVLWNAIMYRMTIRDVKELVDKTIEELQKKKEKGEKERKTIPRELVLIECHLCEAKIPAKDMRTIFLCPHCMNILWDMKLEAKKQVEAEMAKNIATAPSKVGGISQTSGEVVKSESDYEYEIDVSESQASPKDEEKSEKA